MRWGEGGAVSGKIIAATVSCVVTLVSVARRVPLLGAVWIGAASAKLIVSVPRHADIRAKSGDGSIRLERVTGNLELRTGDGSIRATEISGEISLSTLETGVRLKPLAILREAA